MTRGVCWYLVGSLVLVVLAGCGRHAWFGEREAWRGEAEVACLKSGAVREGPAVSILKPISGPGMCGADYPLKVGALGEMPITGYADEAVRPPGAIPQYPAANPRAPITPAATTMQAPRLPSAPSRAGTPYAPDPLYTPAPDTTVRSVVPAGPASKAPGPPLSLAPPGLDPSNVSSVSSAPMYGAPQPSPRAATPPAAMPPGFSPLGPARGALVTGSIGPASVNPPATLACPIVSALDRWITESVQRAALRWYRQPIVEIKQISAYSCRGMNGNSNAHISEHAFGNALDIAAFTFADGRRVTVKDGWHGLPEEQGFLRDVHGAACEQFLTVLAPGSNVYHYDHIHVDLMRRPGGRRICEPAPISGEAAAARARYAGRKGGDASVTGTIGLLPRPPTRLVPNEQDDEEFYENHPHAVPGED